MNEENIFSISSEDIQSLNDMVYLHYGYDFSDYSQASYKRRLGRILSNFNIPNMAELQCKLIQDSYFFNVFLEEVTVNVTEMFRDPEFFKVIRKEVIPQLSTFPMIRIWHAGCSTGEEAFSIAIMMKEAGLLEKVLIYATDINMEVLNKASSSTFPIDLMEGYNENYRAHGGLYELSDYYTIKHGKAIFHEDLRKRMVFSPHNLVADSVFNEFNLIVCRNVMIYFNKPLQNKVINLFLESLSPFGYLALGSKESIDQELIVNRLEVVNRQNRIWRKKN